MHRWLAAALVAMFAAGTALGQEAPALSEAQFHKLVGFIDTIGAKQQLPPPTAQSLGLSNDASLALPVTMVTTDDHKVYFARSDLNRNDYVVWVRAEGNTASYMFATHANLKPITGLYLKENEFPRPIDVTSTQVRTVYRDALSALGKDVDNSASH